MKWTDKKPTKPGWYWVRYYEGDIDVAKVYPCMDDESIWCCQFAGDNGVWLLTEMAESWAGPIPEPDEA